MPCSEKTPVAVSSSISACPWYVQRSGRASTEATAGELRIRLSPVVSVALWGGENIGVDWIF